MIIRMHNIAIVSIIALPDFLSLSLSRSLFLSISLSLSLSLSL